MARYPYKTETYERISLRDLSSGKTEIELTPVEEIEKLEADIADQHENMRAFASNARVVAVSQAKIELLETEIEKWRGAIAAAEQEAFLRVQRAAQYGYPSHLYRARRAAFIAQINGRGIVE